MQDNADQIERLRAEIVLLEATGAEASDEIERLRGALRRIGMPGVEIGYCRDGHEIAVLIARDALREDGR